MLTRGRAGAALLVAVAVLIAAAGCASPEEIARREAESLLQTQQAAIAQTAESLRLTAVAAVDEAIPDLPQLPQPGQPQPAQSAPRFSRLPVAKSNWNNGFGPNWYAEKYWKDAYTKLGGLHNGIDFGAPSQTKVYAGVSGVLTGTSTDAELGGNVAVTVGDYLITYGHTIRNTELVDNQKVEPDTLIGTIAWQANDNHHLHLSVRSGEIYYNPLYFFDAGLINESDWGPYPASRPNEGPYSMILFKRMSTKEASYWEDLNVDKLEIRRP